jgi:lipid-A-disaccharide synthase
LTEVFSKLYSIVKARHNLIKLLKNSRPDLLILIDYPEFNINLARVAKGLGVPVLYYISPQIWAWRRGRVKKIAKRVDRMAVILPFEKEFYLDSGMDINIDYVGHPLLDAVPPGLEGNGIRKSLGLGDGGPILGLLPGSRIEEVRNLLPVMIRASEILSSSYHNLKCVLPVAPTISPDLVVPIVHKSPLEIIISPMDIYRTLSVCDIALVASGTATLEAAIMEVPMVITYRVSSISYWIARRVVKVPHVGLVNLIAGEEIVPELIQNQVTPLALAETALSIMQDEHRKTEMVKGLRRVKEKLGGGGASLKTARIAMQMMEQSE